MWCPVNQVNNLVYGYKETEEDKSEQKTGCSTGCGETGCHPHPCPHARNLRFKKSEERVSLLGAR
jgi:hypothetical protein